MNFYKNLVILLIVSSLFCAEINRADARKVANNVFNKFNKNTTDIFKVKKLDIIESDEKAPLLYIFNLEPCMKSHLFYLEANLVKKLQKQWSAQRQSEHTLASQLQVQEPFAYRYKLYHLF